MDYRRVGRSGLLLPEITLGLWHRFGDTTPYESQRAVVLEAFDLGITHFDLANNYGPPPGAAEASFGRMLETDLATHRDEIVISTKAGYEMWDGPYGWWGSRKHLIASLDQSLDRMGLEYVDIFYSHRFDPETPLEETMSALITAVHQGKALYVGISSYSATKTAEAWKILHDAGVPLLIHQPSYSMFNRWIEADGLLDVLDEHGVGCIAFSSPTGTCRGSPMTRARRRRRTHRSRARCSRRRTSPSPRLSTRSPSLAARRWRRWRSPGRCATGGSRRR
jgi:L-glyceraldehyde 3-phosphate reductase